MEENEKSQRVMLYERAIHLLESAGTGTDEARRLARIEVERIKSQLNIKWLKDFAE